MATTYKTAGIALLLVSVLGVAALGGVVMYKSEASENPNNILGIYSLCEYTQGGVGKDGNWHWYETGDGTYDGEKIILTEYKDHVVKGNAYLDGRCFDIYGLYYSTGNGDGTFSYMSYYDYTPGSNDKVIDVLRGYISGPMMILTGYTVSAQNGDQAYAFNFVFVKDGKQPYIPRYTDINFGTLTTENAYNVDVDENKTDLGEQEYTELEFRNGVYRLLINGVEAAGVTVNYSDYDVTNASYRTLLNIVYLDDGVVCTEWLGFFDRSRAIAFANSSWDNSLDIIQFGMSASTPYGTKYTVDASVYSSKDDKSTKYTFERKATYSEKEGYPCSFVTNDYGMKYIMTGVMKQNSATFHFNYEGTEYYGQMIYSGSSAYGMFVSTDGKILLVDETLKR